MAADPIVAWTKDYEAWLAAHLPFVVAADVAKKHADMAGAAFVFLRGTYYAWARQLPAALPGLMDAPRVTSVGDLHLENFGTWRDAEGRLAWGINDFDEASVLPYTNDLVRLATSVGLARDDGIVETPADVLADAVLGGYRECLDRGGAPVFLGDERRRLREHLLENLIRGLHERPRKRKKKGAPAADAPREAPADCLQALGRALPPGTEDVAVAPRTAGVGSLGRPRFVATGVWTGSAVRREAKSRAPSAVAWASAAGAPEKDDAFAFLLEHARRSPDPFLHLAGRWVVRRLTADTDKMELVAGALPRTLERDLAGLMGRELANVHAAAPGALRPILGDLARRRPGWLLEAAGVMTGVTRASFKAWKKSERQG